jgi:hypothetical protein
VYHPNNSKKIPAETSVSVLIKFQLVKFLEEKAGIAEANSNLAYYTYFYYPKNGYFRFKSCLILDFYKSLVGSNSFFSLHLLKN